MTWNTKLDSGGVLVSDKITLEFELSLIKKVDEAAPTDAPATADEATPTDAAEASMSKADEQLPPPPPIKPADKPAEQPAQAQSAEPQSAEKPRGRLFGLR